MGLNSGCSSPVCNHSATVFVWRMFADSSCLTRLLLAAIGEPENPQHWLYLSCGHWPTGQSLRSRSGSFCSQVRTLLGSRNGGACLSQPAEPLSFLAVFVPRRKRNTGTCWLDTEPQRVAGSRAETPKPKNHWFLTHGSEIRSNFGNIRPWWLLLFWIYAQLSP